ncbi:hypothetical protein [Rhizobium mesoamericanum]|uniref:Uncharacterized protein n=1 Tax=Rhizobium mesoamericanum STM3625 TaxID=1211777 RepID=K0Q4L7_9HYPH|nr:hypothetical protein [Rhizobium mesoamericanum]CCM79522.1 hypothetical protein BN77_p10805 [Rhizobium mesoamericanum STM3625]
MQMFPDSSTIKLALKTLCRETGVERDRRAVGEIATLMTALWKQDVHDGEELRRLSRQDSRNEDGVAKAFQVQLDSTFLRSKSCAVRGRNGFWAAKIFGKSQPVCK